jgi:hypothetical protein
MPSVYLGGPISGLSDSDAMGWRAHARLWFQRFGIEVIDPMRRDYRAGWEDPMDVVWPDVEDIMAATVCLFNFWKLSAGTPMELAYAHGMGKPTSVAWQHQPSPWIEAHATIVSDALDTAIAQAVRLCR